MHKMKVTYIAETSLTNKSAYSHHVIKMCDTFTKLDHDTILITSKKNFNFNYKKLKNDFALKGKKSFKVLSFTKFNSENFFTRILFGIKAAVFLKNHKADLILSRSIITSFILSLFKIHHFLEIHSELKSFTKFIMVNLNFINSDYIIKIILISKALNKVFNLENKKILILHDGVDIDNFKRQKIINNIKSASYIGSFYKGRGIKLITNLAKNFGNLKFNLYGDKSKALKSKISKIKNLKFCGFVKYKEVPKILSKSDILLMPYSNNVEVRAKGINTAKYCSPLKMFDYLAAGKIIISSKLDGINEVLKHNKNAILVKNFDYKSWEKSIFEILDGKYNIKNIQKNSLKTAQNFTWEKRAKKIIKARRI